MRYSRKRIFFILFFFFYNILFACVTRFCREKNQNETDHRFMPCRRSVPIKNIKSAQNVTSQRNVTRTDTLKLCMTWRTWRSSRTCWTLCPRWRRKSFIHARTHIPRRIRCWTRSDDIPNSMYIHTHIHVSVRVRVPEYNVQHFGPFDYQSCSGRPFVYTSSCINSNDNNNMCIHI